MTQRRFCRAGQCALLVGSLGALATSLVFAQPDDGPGQSPSALGKGPAHTVQEGLHLEHGLMPDFDSFRRTAMGGRVSIEGVELSDGRRVDLDLERFHIFAPDAQFIVGTARGDIHVAPPDVVLLRGSVRGDADSRVYIAVGAHGTQGAIDLGDEMHFVSTGSYGQDEGLRITDSRDAFAPMRRMPVGCQVDVHDPKFSPLGQPETDGRSRGVDPPCRVAQIAIDTDWEFTGNLFDGNTDAAMEYAIALMGANSEIYRRDVNVRITLPFLRVWEADVDPYDAGGAGDMLGQFRNHWLDNHAHVDRHLAHMVSGDNLGGGVAYLSVTCSDQWGYAVSGNIGGSFPYPLEDNSHQNWDVMVTCHETGHNMGTGHTHDSYDPPIDGCGNGDCSLADQGTIMSYCHLCAGGLSNIRLGFHELVIERILEYLASIECDMESEGATAVEDFHIVAQNAVSVVDALANDYITSCTWDVELGSYDRTTTLGGSVNYVGPGEGEEYGHFLYTAPLGHTGYDQFDYALSNGSSTSVTLSIVPMRESVDLAEVSPGVATDYFEVIGFDMLPIFDLLVPYASELIADVNFPSTGGAFAGSGRSDEVGAVFQAYVLIEETGIHTLSIESDDGSKLYIGDDLLIDNDGLHGMVEKSAAIGLESGYHPIRVEFFENFGGAGMIVRMSTSDGGRVPIPAELWFQEGAAACEADIAGDDLVVDAQDLIFLLAAWGDCVDCAADFNDDDVVDAADLIYLLARWGDC